MSAGGGAPEIGAWSKKGEFLGRVRHLGCGTGREEGGDAFLSASRGSEERGIAFTLHSFRGGYRVLVKEWGRAERELWLAPVAEEEESYIGLFSEEEARETFPYLFAALVAPTSVEVG